MKVDKLLIKVLFLALLMQGSYAQSITNTSNTTLLIATQAINANKIRFIGTDEEYTFSELKAKLASEGQDLVVADQIDQGECLLSYDNPSTGTNEANADFGVLVCSVIKNDRVYLETSLIHGGCNLSAQLGASASCSISTLNSKFGVNINNATLEFSSNGPAVEVCGANGKDVCLEAGATVAEQSITLLHDDGYGAGIGVGIGIGAGLSGSYKEGILSVGGEIKIGFGIEFEFNLDPKNPKSYLCAFGLVGTLLCTLT